MATDPGDAQEEWDILDGQIFILILNSLHSQLTEFFVHHEIAKELWDAITDQHSNQSNNSHIFQIKKDITEITQGSKIVSELITQVKSKYHELKLYKPITTDLSVLQEREELDQIYTFFDALDPSYDSIRAQILNSTERLTFAGVTARIQQEESRRVAMNVSDQNRKPESHDFAAMNSQAQEGKKGAHTTIGTTISRTAARSSTLTSNLSGRAKAEVVVKTRGAATQGVSGGNPRLESGGDEREWNDRRN
jgi:gag-polypeptide of LTR copia-type